MSMSPSVKSTMQSSVEQEPAQNSEGKQTATVLGRVIPLVSQKLSTDDKTDYSRTGIKGILHRLLPTQAYDLLRSARMNLDQSPTGAKLKLAEAYTLEVVAKSGVLSGLYYAGSRAYDREHRGTLTAKARYLRDVFAHEGSIFVLRRNVHKIEKALIMKPRRPIFAIGYLRETVDSFEDCAVRLQSGRLQDTDTMSWARQVLGVYFQSITGSHPVIDACKIIYERALNHFALSSSDKERVPFVRPACEIPTYDQLFQLALHRRSVRWFDGKPVPRELIDKAVLLAGLSPSACNRQPFRFAIFDEPALVQKIGAIPKGTPGWVHNIPCFVVIVGTLEAFDREKDRHIPYIDGSLAAMSLCFALETLGISTCCVNWPDLADTEARMTKALGLKPFERPVMCLAVGYPDAKEKVPYSQKLPLNQLRSYNDVPR
jgi:nitroreductase